VGSLVASVIADVAIGGVTLTAFELASGTPRNTASPVYRCDGPFAVATGALVRVPQ
jgi:hypothetical protein